MASRGWERRQLLHSRDGESGSRLPAPRRPPPFSLRRLSHPQAAPAASCCPARARTRARARASPLAWAVPCPARGPFRHCAAPEGGALGSAPHSSSSSFSRPTRPLRGFVVEAAAPGAGPRGRSAQVTGRRGASFGGRSRGNPAPHPEPRRAPGAARSELPAAPPRRLAAPHTSSPPRRASAAAALRAVEPRSSPRRGGGSASLPSAPPRAFGSPRPAPNRGSRAASCPLWGAGFGVSIDVTAVRRGDTGRLASARRKGSRWQGYSEATK